MGAGKMTAVFLQVRLDSQRFPQKALAELAGRTVIEHAMAALNDVSTDRHVVLTDEASASRLSPYAKRGGFELYAGDPDDVLARFAAAAKRYGPKTIVRATGDNPLVSTKVAAANLETHFESQSDFTALTDSPLGTGVEVVEVPALLQAAEEAEDPYEREHVSPFIYRRRERFRVHVQSVPAAWRYPQARVTLDTKDDYEYLKEIFKTLYSGSPIGIESLVAHLARAEHRPGVSRRHSA
ncbi:MAG: NTP transferase domain-containing protein [Spirochaetia bacterium]